MASREQQLDILLRQIVITVMVKRAVRSVTFSREEIAEFDGNTYWNRLLRIRDNDNGYSLDLVPIGETEDRCCHRMGHQLEKAIALLIGDAEVEITAADVASAQAACVDLFINPKADGECVLRLEPHAG